MQRLYPRRSGKIKYKRHHPWAYMTYSMFKGLLCIKVGHGQQFASFLMNNRFSKAQGLDGDFKLSFQRAYFILQLLLQK